MDNIARRDRILRLLVETVDGGAAQVIETGPGGTMLVTQHNEPVLVIAAPESAEGPAGESALAARLVDLAGRVTGPTVHVVVVGGGDEVRALLSDNPVLQLKLNLRLHHVDSAGAYHLLGRNHPLEFVARAAGRVAADPDAIAPITAEELQAAQARTAAAVADHNRFGKVIAAGGKRVTMAIAGVLAALFGLELLFGDGEVRTVLFAMGANHGRTVAAGEPWRLFSSAFLHGGVAHAVLNTVSLLALGPLLEGLLRPWRFAVLYLLCALGGAAVSAAVHPDVVSIGASGAIWGLMAANAGLALRPQGLLPETVAKQMKQRIWGPLAFNLLYSFQGGIDLACHLGGGAVGLLLVASGAVTRGLPPITEENGKDRYAALFRAGALLLGALALASIALALARGRAWEIAHPGQLRPVVPPPGAIAVSLPPRLEPHPQADGKLVLYGSLDRDPMIVGLTVLGPMSAEESAAFTMEDARQQWAAEAPSPLVTTKPPVIERVVDREALTQTGEFKNGAHEKVYLVREGDYLVRVELLWTDATPAAWTALGPQIVQSVAPSGEAH